MRRFSDKEVEALKVIDCLKRSGLEIRDIKQFMKWCTKGPSTYGKRKELFEKRKTVVEEELRQLNKTLDMLKFKCWYYETAIKDGSEDKLNQMLPDHLPKNIQKLYDSAHSE